MADLSRRGGGPGIRLKGAQPAPVSVTTNAATYGIAINISGINISAGLTQLCSVDVPAEKEMIVLEASITGLTTTAQATVLEFEKDGETVLTTGSVSTSSDRLLIVGSNVTQNSGRLVEKIVVSSNFKIRAQKAAGTSVTVQVSYILTERS